MSHFEPEMLDIHVGILDKPIIKLPPHQPHIDYGSDSDVDSISDNGKHLPDILSTTPSTMNRCNTFTCPLALTIYHGDVEPLLTYEPYVCYSMTQPIYYTTHLVTPQIDRFNTTIPPNLINPPYTTTLPILPILPDLNSLPSIPIPTVAPQLSFPILSTSFSSYFTLPPPSIKVCYSDDKIRYMCDLPRQPTDNQYQKSKVNVNILISIMLMKHYVPVNRTTLYVLMNEYKSTGKLKHTNWREKMKSGLKPCLERSSITKVIKYYHAITEGGCCSSKADLEKSSSTAIRKEVEGRDQFKERMKLVPETFINCYAKKIMTEQKNYATLFQ